MFNKKVYIFVLLLLTSQSALALSQCKCTSSNTAFPGSDTKPSEKISISTENEMIDTTDIGKLITFSTTTILQKIYVVQKSSSASLVHNCPSGYSPLTQDELKVIIARPDFADLIGASYLNLDFTINTYYSSTKVNPSSTSGSDNNSYIYYILKLDANNKPIIDKESTYYDKKVKSTICKRVPISSTTVYLEGYEGYDLEKGKTYELKITNRNVQKYYIEDNNGNVFTTQTFSYTHKGNNNWGCATLNVRLQIFGGEIVGDCVSIWTKPQFAFNADSSISIDQIQKVTLKDVKANVNNGMFFSPGSAPIAPIVDDSSSFYLFYSDKTTKALRVQKLSKEGALIGSPIDTKEIGDPFDIVSTEFGFVVMARDSTQRVWIQAINKDGSNRWKRNLINNGDKPDAIKEQIKFFSNDKCELPFGMQIMFNPHNGRLNYARGKIQAIWAHYNHFGMKDGKRDDHTGDTMISLDADTGYDQKIFWSWGCSHSLYQNLHYDGKKLYVASLGDAFPMQILFKVCDIDTYTCISSSTVIPGAIPGNGGGMASGRESSFIDIVGSRGEKFFIYQRKAATGGYSGSTSTNDKNEFAIIRLNKDLKLISTQAIISDSSSARVNNIKAVRYGKNILVAYTMIPQAEVQNYNRQNINQAVDESYVTLLSGTDGSIIYQPTKFLTFQVNSSDDWRILEDGRIVYTLVDKDNNLNIYYTPAISTPAYPNPIKISDKTYGYGTFTNIKVAPKKNNFNDVCLKQGDSNWSIVDFPGAINNNGGSGSGNNNDQITNVSTTSAFQIGFTLLNTLLLILIL